MDIMKELQEIFRDVFDDENLVIAKETSAKDIEDWDSLAQIRLVVAMEKHFHVKLPVDKVAMFENVGDMEALIESQLN